MAFHDHTRTLYQRDTVCCEKGSNCVQTIRTNLRINYLRNTSMYSYYILIMVWPYCGANYSAWRPYCSRDTKQEPYNRRLHHSCTIVNAAKWWNGRAKIRKKVHLRFSYFSRWEKKNWQYFGVITCRCWRCWVHCKPCNERLHSQLRCCSAPFRWNCRSDESIGE